MRPADSEPDHALRLRRAQFAKPRLAGYDMTDLKRKVGWLSVCANVDHGESRLDNIDSVFYRRISEPGL